MIRMTYTNRFALLALAALTGALAVAPLRPAIAADPAGTWLTETGTSRIRIADCGGALCGTVVWMKEPIDPETHQPRLDKFNADTAKRGRPLMGVTIVLGMKPSGPEKWSGQVYNAEDGKTYEARITITDPNTLKLRGCIFVPLCKNQTWTRVR
jgi:uncharacterized protein (DUF2147 family)